MAGRAVVPLADRTQNVIAVDEDGKIEIAGGRATAES
jgi:hypothetical protein